MSAQEELSFEEALAELDSLVDKLESGELSLENSLKEFEAGIKLSRFCAKVLDDTEERVEMIIENEAGDLEVKPYNSSGKE